MPARQAHKRATVLVAPATGLLVGLVTGDLVAGLAAWAGGLATLAIHPDLDVLESSFHRKMSRGGLALVWWLLWLPYAKSLRHRGPFSHWPVIGTIGRVVYVGWLPVMALLTFYHGSLDNLWLFASFLVLGMMVSDTVHWFMDQL